MGNITIIFGVGPKELATPAHFISSPWPMPRKKKCPRMNKESPDCQDMLSRTTLSLVDQDHEKGRCHATKGSLLEHPNGKPKHHGPAVGAWRRSNPRKGRHLHIKYPLGMAIFTQSVGTRSGPTLMGQILPDPIRNRVGFGFFKKNPNRVQVGSRFL